MLKIAGDVSRPDGKIVTLTVTFARDEVTIVKEIDTEIETILMLTEIEGNQLFALMSMAMPGYRD